ncbi:hypothetical protein [Planktotalea sp.]|uniref:hypothetical protein n=1 Tax=Planktotalea sp. TaxID=2029877 RepID=UPI003D6B337A
MSLLKTENDVAREIEIGMQLILGIALFVVGLVWFTGVLDPLAQFLGGQQLNESNQAYIQSVQAGAVKELATLGAILAVVDVVSSVELGFNFVASANVSVGHAIHSLGLLLNQGVDALVLSTAAFEVLTFLLAISNAVSGTIFAFAMIGLGLLLIARGMGAEAKLTALLEDVAFIAIALFLFTYIIVPYSIQISAWSSLEITHALHTSTREGLAALHSDIVERATDASSAKEWVKKGTALSAFDHLSNDLTQKVEAAGSLVWSFWARVLTHAILVPLFVGLVLKLVLHRVLKFVVSQ